MRIIIAGLVVVAAGLTLTSDLGRAQSPDYQLVADWPRMPPGTFFGQQTGWPDQSARDAAAAARQAAAARRSRGGDASTPPIYGQGVSGIAIDGDDHVYVFNRGQQTVMVFDREGHLVRAGAERDQDGVQVAGGWLHSGEVDWDGNVWVVERLNHRILKFDPMLERALMQLGTTGEPGTDETHLNSPSGILFTREGNAVVTDGYGNNRVILYSPDGTFIKQIGRGDGGPTDKGTGPAEWDLPHQGAVDADDTRMTRSISSTVRTDGSRCSTISSTTSASSRTKGGTLGISPSPGKGTMALAILPTTPASGFTRSRLTMVAF